MGLKNVSIRLRHFLDCGKNIGIFFSYVILFISGLNNITFFRLFAYTPKDIDEKRMTMTTTMKKRQQKPNSHVIVVFVCHFAVCSLFLPRLYHRANKFSAPHTRKNASSVSCFRFV